jgi:hypothetical protein
VTGRHENFLSNTRKSNCGKKRGGHNKLAFQKVQDGFKKQGLTLLDTKYVNSSTPMQYRCDIGHEGRLKWNHVQQGHGCAKCAGVAKLTLKEVQEGFRKQRLTLLDLEYVNCFTPMRYLCDMGHEGKMAWSSVRQGKGCAKCAGNVKPEHKEVQEGFRKQGLTLLDLEYVNSFTPIRYQCDAGHEGEKSWASVQQGYGCAKCAGVAKLTLKEVQEGFRRQRLTLLDLEYVNCFTPMRYLCDMGHEGKISWNNFQKGKGCAKCAEYGFNPAKPAILYYVQIFPENHPPVYKIGITNSTIKKRFGNITKSYRIIQSWNYKVGQDAYDREQELLTKYSAQRIPAEIGRKLVRAGHTELFYGDILGLDLSSKAPTTRSHKKTKTKQLTLWGGSLSSALPQLPKPGNNRATGKTGRPKNNPNQYNFAII